MKQKSLFSRFLLAFFLLVSTMLPQGVLAQEPVAEEKSAILTLYKEENTPDVEIEVVKDDVSIHTDTMSEGELEIFFKDKEDGKYTIQYTSSDQNYELLKEKDEVELKDGDINPKTLFIDFKQVEKEEEKEETQELLAPDGDLAGRASANHTIIRERIEFQVRPGGNYVNAKMKIVALNGPEQGRVFYVNSGERFEMYSNASYLVTIEDFPRDRYYIKEEAAVFAAYENGDKLFSYARFVDGGIEVLEETRDYLSYDTYYYDMKNVLIELKDVDYFKDVSDPKDYQTIEKDAELSFYNDLTRMNYEAKIVDGKAVVSLPNVGNNIATNLPQFEEFELGVSEISFSALDYGINNPLMIGYNPLYAGRYVEFDLETYGYNYALGQYFEAPEWKLPVMIGFKKDGKIIEAPIFEDVDTHYEYTGRTDTFVRGDGAEVHILTPGKYTAVIKDTIPHFVFDEVEHEVEIDAKSGHTSPGWLVDKYVFPARLAKADYKLVFQDQDGKVIENLEGVDAKFNSIGFYTNKDGFQDRVLGGELTVGDYELEVSSAPEGYELLEDKVVRNFEIKEDGDDKEIVIQVKEIKQVGTLELFVKGEDGKKLDGVIELVNNDTGEVIEVDVVDGVALETQFAPGIYSARVKEVTFGYDANDIVIRRPVSNGSYSKFTFTAGYAEYYAQIKKVDEEGNPLEGAVFELYQDGEMVETFESDRDGIAYMFQEVNIYEDFYIKEIEAPAGYEFFDEPIKLEVIKENYVDTKGNGDPEDFEIVMEVVNKKIEIKEVEVVGKNIDEDGNPMQDGKFVVIDKESGQEIEIIVEDGTIKTNLPEGDYTMKQTEAPKGYEVSPEEKDFSVSKDGEVVGDDLVFTSNYTKYQIKISKVNEINQPIAKVEFTVFNEVDGSQKTYTTDEQGLVELEVIIKDTMIKETKGHKAHSMSEEEYQIEHLEDQVQEISVLNERKFIQVEIDRQDKDGNNVDAPSKVIVVDKNTKEEYEVELVDGKGVVKLPAGDFEIKETESPKEYLPAEDVEISVNEDMEVEGEPVLSSDRKTYPIEVIHNDERNDAISGGVFEVVNKDTGAKETIILEEGKTSIDLPAGNYEIKQIDGPEGYEVSKEIKEITLEDGQDNESQLDFTSDFSQYKVLVKKTNEIGKELEGVVFELSNKTTGTKTSQTTNSSGELSFTVNLFDEYEVVEKEGHKAHHSTNEVFAVEVNTEEDTIIEVVNNRKFTEVEIERQDKDGNPVEGDSKVTIVDKETGEEYEVDLTDGKGKVELPSGDFEIKEKETPEGYEPAPDIELKVDEDMEIDEKPILSSDKKLYSVDVKHIDERGNLVDGGVYELVDKKTGEVKELEFVDGELKLELAAGDYIIRQSNELVGYENAEEIEFTISKDGQVSEDVELVSNYKLYPLEVLKVNEIEKALEGVEFTLSNLTTDEEETLTTDAEGKLVFELNLFDEYKLEETKGHKAHNTQDEEIEFEINSDGGFVKVVNERKRIEVEIERQDKDGNPTEGDSSVTIVDKNTGEEYEVDLTDGKGKVELPAGDFEVKEKDTPEGYEPAPDVDLNINEDMEVEKDPILTSDLKKHPVDVVYTDERGNKISGEFEVENLETGKKELVVIEDGQAVVNLPAGDYKIVQKEGSDGYEFAKDLEFTVSKDGSISNSPELVSDYTLYELVVNKENEIGQKLEDVEFTLTNSFDDSQTTSTTDEDGKAVFMVNAFDDYSIKETKGHKTHLSTEEVFEVEFKDGVVQEINVVNHRKKVQVEIGREDLEGNKVDGDSKVTIVDKNTKEEYEVELVDGKGKVDLPAGDYEVKETETPEGYLPAPDISININEDMELEEDPILKSDKEEEPVYEVEVIHKDEDGDKVNGGRFEIKNKETGETEIIELPEGETTIHLPEGDYTIVELDKVDGYEPKEDIEITVKPNDENKVEIESDLSKYKFVITKVNEIGQKLEGVEFEISRPDGSKSQIATTNEEGVLVFEISFKDYILKETKGAKGHIKDETIYDVKVDINQEETRKTIVNNRKFVEVEIERKDEEGNPIEGESSVVVVDKNTGEEYEVEIVDGKGIVELPSGDFTVKEKDTPEGYNPAPEVDFEVNDELKVEKDVVLENEKIKDEPEQGGEDDKPVSPEDGDGEDDKPTNPEDGDGEDNGGEDDKPVSPEEPEDGQEQPTEPEDNENQGGEETPTEPEDKEDNEELPTEPEDTEDNEELPNEPEDSEDNEPISPEDDGDKGTQDKDDEEEDDDNLVIIPDDNGQIDADSNSAQGNPADADAYPNGAPVDTAATSSYFAYLVSILMALAALVFAKKREYQ